jgi:peptidoglycan endopeptidase LytE
MYACNPNLNANPPLEETLPPSEETSPSEPENPEKPQESPPVVIVKQTQEYIRCTGENVNLRSGAGTDFSVLGQAEKGETFAVVKKSGSWYEIGYKNKKAYLYADYATAFTLEKSENEEVEDVLQKGYSLLGVPYVYGAVRLHDGKGRLLSGFSTLRFDCSSLVQYVFYKGADLLLNTTTRTQVTQGKFVPKSELTRGDCIYFTNETRQYKTGIERVGHVASYLGNDYILHTASDYARIEKMSAQRWKFYIEARRFV